MVICVFSIGFLIMGIKDDGTVYFKKIYYKKILKKELVQAVYMTSFDYSQLYWIF